MLQLPDSVHMRTLPSVEDAYQLCRQITAKYSTTFYLSTLLFGQEKRKAFWAIYTWCRRIDELVDGPAATITTPETLEMWESQLESIFAGNPVEAADVALVDTIQRFPLEIQPFRDMIAGQQMDLYRSRYETFEELNLYCYRVAGSVGLMSKAVLGIDSSNNSTPWNQDREPYVPTEEAIALGIAKQLTNILRDVGEDARRGRIYIPLEDLAKFNYTEQDLFKGVIDERWRKLMQFQIQRARQFYAKAEKGIKYLSPDAHWQIWVAMLFYSQILDRIERNQYDVFHKRAYVPQLQKLRTLPVAWLRSQVL
ncbi:MAG: phytoene synthase [Chroococcidiopsidaceae cyanobacterium CP_BM_ER_R8_30]|nr:phytoene synthase [Chroococcidiopsidaceae cyanobacterium CP_BM_ER_R8_30]